MILRHVLDRFTAKTGWSKQNPKASLRVAENIGELRASSTEEVKRWHEQALNSLGVS
jgi:hypothetical protein